MIKNIIDLLKMYDFYDVSEDMDVAKGKYQVPQDWSSVRNLFKRM
jgi:hypothetical protein